MLAPLRDYLSPQEPASSSLLCATRDRYFAQVPPVPNPSDPGFEESRWIVSEDVNVEFLLDVFLSICPDSADFWWACEKFMMSLYWHKGRRTILGPKVESLPDDHPAKPGCLCGLSRLFKSVGNYVEEERLLVHTLELRRDQGDEILVAETLRDLADASRMRGHSKEGVQYAKEALEIFQRLGATDQEAPSLNYLARVLYNDKQFDAAEDILSQMIDRLPEKGQEYLVCQSHRLLGDIHRSKGEKEKAIHHLEVALGIAPSFNWQDELFWIQYSLAQVFHGEGEFGKANSHIEQAKSQTVDHTYTMGRAMQLQAEIWYGQGRLEEAMSEALLAIETYEKLGLAQDVETCRDILQSIEEAMESQSAPGESKSDTYDARPSTST